MLNALMKVLIASFDAEEALRQGRKEVIKRRDVPYDMSWTQEMAEETLKKAKEKANSALVEALAGVEEEKKVGMPPKPLLEVFSSLLDNLDGKRDTTRRAASFLKKTQESCDELNKLKLSD